MLLPKSTILVTCFSMILKAEATKMVFVHIPDSLATLKNEKSSDTGTKVNSGRKL